MSRSKAKKDEINCASGEAGTGKKARTEVLERAAAPAVSSEGKPEELEKASVAPNLSSQDPLPEVHLESQQIPLPEAFGGSEDESQKPAAAPEPKQMTTLIISLPPDAPAASQQKAKEQNGLPDMKSAVSKEAARASKLAKANLAMTKLLAHPALHDCRPHRFSGDMKSFANLILDHLNLQGPRGYSVHVINV